LNSDDALPLIVECFHEANTTEETKLSRKIRQLVNTLGLLEL